ncbi:MAG TPA: GNAT family N-acetyltransferase [Mycobacteriales bacterium]|jgi:GNAT superfamily N-acetyltransferase|nr:GNAT family N-acetyltransferase [Mycobacteriales bacterium]
MRVRRATPDDAPELVRLRGVMFDAMGVDHAAEPEWPAACERVLRDRLASGEMAAFVVDGDGGGLAAGGVGMVAQRLPSPRNPNGLHGYVQSMATDPAARRRGYAREVFAALLEWFAERGVGSVDLHATEAGAALYRQFGFSEPRHPTLGWRAPR